MENENTEIIEEIKPEAPKKKKKLFGKIKTKNIALAAVLTAISFVLPYFIPSIIIPPDMSVTLLSHTPIFIAMFINPFVAVFTCIGTLGAFMAKPQTMGLPTVWIRAGSHIIFAIVGSVIMSKWKKGYKGVSFYTVCGIITLIHAVFEMLSALIAFAIAAPGAPAVLTSRYIFIVVGLVTVVHSIFDYSFAVLIYNTLSQARLVKNRFDLRIIKKRKIMNNP